MEGEKRKLTEGRRFIDEKELAALYGVAVQTVRNWRFLRKGPSYSKLGRMIRYDLDCALSFMDAHEVKLEKHSP